jgi:hypothetical protein
MYVLLPDAILKADSPDSSDRTGREGLGYIIVQHGCPSLHI